MFKNIFDNKIGERLTTINTSSKSAMEWMGKYTQQINITDKIQQINESQLLKNPISTQSSLKMKLTLFSIAGKRFRSKVKQIIRMDLIQPILCLPRQKNESSLKRMSNALKLTQKNYTFV